MTRKFYEAQKQVGRCKVTVPSGDGRLPNSADQGISDWYKIAFVGEPKLY